MATIGKLLGTGLLLTVIGCSQSDRGGGTKRATSFTLDGPGMATTIHQGEGRTVSLTLHRGSDFKQDVKLKAEAPVGVEAALSERDIKVNDKGDISLRLAVGNSVTPGEHIVQVVGTPESGTPAKIEVRINVAEKSDNTKLTLRGPLTATTLKQGETRIAKISLEPNAKYQAAVKLQAEAPAGIKAEISPRAAEIKAAERSEADLKITADKNASAGEYTIRVTGTGDAATVRPVDVRVKVVAP